MPRKLPFAIKFRCFALLVSTASELRQMPRFISFLSPDPVSPDLQGLPADFLPLLPRHNLINEQVIARFIPAYVIVHDASAQNPRKLIPFATNENVGPFSPLDDYLDLVDSNGFWAHLVVAAYQGDEEYGDPEPDMANGGRTKGITYDQRAFYNIGESHSAIFLETIRDQYHDILTSTTLSPLVVSSALERFRNDVYGTVAHEIAHTPPQAFGQDKSDHWEGGLLGTGNSEIDTLRFSPVTIQRFRYTGSWNNKQ